MHNHAVLVVSADADHPRVLDIDADEDAGFVRDVVLTDDTRRSCTRLLHLPSVERGRPFDAAATAEIVADSVAPLRRFAAAAAALRSLWADAVGRPLANAADLWVLGDIQPQVYLFAQICRRDGRSELAALAEAVADRALRTSLFLAGLRRLGRHRPYRLCLTDFKALADELDELARAAGRAAHRRDAPGPDDSAADWLVQRLDSLSSWHFGSGLPPVR